MLLTEWRKLRGYAGRKQLYQQKTAASPDFAVVEYEIKVPERFNLEGRRLLFFSDQHWESSKSSLKQLAELAENIHPDWIVFGGDLTNYACFFDEAFSALATTFSNLTGTAKIAVPGNWDRRRKSWFPNSLWSEKYAEIGFHYLKSDSLIINGMNFLGLDDSRNGAPTPRGANLSVEHFNCVAAHNPAAIADSFVPFLEREFPGNDYPKPTTLALCGHTHGGQIRIPGFGALLTSTKYWKLFEYGWYEHKKTGVEMIVTSGLGTSRLPIRLFCEPEVVVVTLVGER
jgi:predicted MPP superfamily phosphohydrolase